MSGGRSLKRAHSLTGIIKFKGSGGQIKRFSVVLATESSSSNSLRMYRSLTVFISNTEVNRSTRNFLKQNPLDGDGSLWPESIETDYLLNSPVTMILSNVGLTEEEEIAIYQNKQNS